MHAPQHAPLRTTFQRFYLSLTTLGTSAMCSAAAGSDLDIGSTCILTFYEELADSIVFKVDYDVMKHQACDQHSHCI